MLHLRRVRIASTVVVGLLCFYSAAVAQSGSNSLQGTISALDTALFSAVNQCDMSKVESFWAEDAEFLHDKSEPMDGKRAIVASIKNNLCGKVTRELVPGTMEVYPLQGYGAVEIGIHRFLHPGTQDHGVVGEAKFIHVWRHREDGWKITRVISYDHHTVN
jgi:ketosteroid isomerase-like protein